jgi:hypothetical protein
MRLDRQAAWNSIELSSSGSAILIATDGSGGGCLPCIRVCFCVGGPPLDHHATFKARVINLIVVSILAAFAVWRSYRKSRKIQRQIDAIEAMKEANGFGHATKG